MKSCVLFVSLILLPPSALADCAWSDKKLIPLSKSVTYELCTENNTIRINNKIIVQPNIKYEFFSDRCQKCIVIWSRISPDHETAIVWIENNQYQRNAWVIDLRSNTIKLFIDASESEGRHFLVKFNGPDKFTIAHAGMGYETDYFYKKDGFTWVNVGKEEVGVQLR